MDKVTMKSLQSYLFICLEYSFSFWSCQQIYYIFLCSVVQSCFLQFVYLIYVVLWLSFMPLEAILFACVVKCSAKSIFYDFGRIYPYGFYPFRTLGGWGVGCTQVRGSSSAPRGTSRNGSQPQKTSCLVGVPCCCCADCVQIQHNYAMVGCLRGCSLLIY